MAGITAIKTQEPRTKKPTHRLVPITTQELDDLEAEYDDLTSQGIYYDPRSTNEVFRRYVNVRSRLIYYGRIITLKHKITLRDLGPTATSAPSAEYEHRSEYVDRLQKRYKELRNKGVKYNKKPETAEEREILNLYRKIYYHREKLIRMQLDEGL